MLRTHCDSLVNFQLRSYISKTRDKKAWNVLNIKFPSASGTHDSKIYMLLQGCQQAEKSTLSSDPLAYFKGNFSVNKLNFQRKFKTEPRH